MRPSRKWEYKQESVDRRFALPLSGEGGRRFCFVSLPLRWLRKERSKYLDDPAWLEGGREQRHFGGDSLPLPMGLQAFVRRIPTPPVEHH